jgi:hypothetical protein
LHRTISLPLGEVKVLLFAEIAPRGRPAGSTTKGPAALRPTATEDAHGHPPLLMTLLNVRQRRRNYVEDRFNEAIAAVAADGYRRNRTQEVSLPPRDSRPTGLEPATSGVSNSRSARPTA